MKEVNNGMWWVMITGTGSEADSGTDRSWVMMGGGRHHQAQLISVDTLKNEDPLWSLQVSSSLTRGSPRQCAALMGVHRHRDSHHGLILLLLLRQLSKSQTHMKELIKFWFIFKWFTYLSFLILIAILIHMHWKIMSKHKEFDLYLVLLSTFLHMHKLFITSHLGLSLIFLG